MFTPEKRLLFFFTFQNLGEFSPSVFVMLYGSSDRGNVFIASQGVQRVRVHYRAGRDSVSESHLSAQSPGNVSLLFKGIKLPVKWRNTAPHGKYGWKAVHISKLVFNWVYFSQIVAELVTETMCVVSMATEDEVATAPVLKLRSLWFGLSLHTTVVQWNVTQSRVSGPRVHSLRKWDSASVLLKVTSVGGRVDVTGDWTWRFWWKDGLPNQCTILLPIRVALMLRCLTSSLVLRKRAEM